MKLTKGKIIAAVAVIAVLAGAFWYGGNAPGLQGWTVQEQESSAVLEAAPPASYRDTWRGGGKPPADGER